MSYGVKPPNYRLPESAHIGRVRLQVADLARSIAYYETVIGFRVLGRDGGVARMGAQGDDRVLVELHEKAGVRSVARRRTHRTVSLRDSAPRSCRTRPLPGASGRARGPRRHVGSYRQ